MDRSKVRFASSSIISSDSTPLTSHVVGSPSPLVPVLHVSESFETFHFHMLQTSLVPKAWPRRVTPPI
jgi:hypothetical protein